VGSWSLLNQGVDLLKKLVKKELKFKIIVISASVTEIKAFSKSEFDGSIKLLIKPFDVEELSILVESLIDVKRKK